MQREATILVAEDNDDDFQLLTHAFETGDRCCALRRTRDGDETIAYLDGTGPFSDRGQHPLPNLLLLDLQMPGRDGFEVLRWLRTQPNFRTLPVIVLTSSLDHKDIKLAYELGANAYLRKPNTWHLYRVLAADLTEFWLAWNEGPPDFPFSRPSSRTTAGKHALQTAVLTISDPRGNWDYGWKLICELAGLDPRAFLAPFRYRSEDDMKPVIEQKKNLTAVATQNGIST